MSSVIEEYYDPYNPNNVQITKRDVETILRTYNVHPQVHNMTLYRRAFIHESYVRKNVSANLAKLSALGGGGNGGDSDSDPLPNNYGSGMMDTEESGNLGAIEKRIKPPGKDELPLASKSNQRLEFLGDGILEAVAKFWIYRNFPKASEGFMTDIKINLVKNQAIGRISQEMGLNRWMIIEKGMEAKLRNNEHQMGCLFESFLGAMFLDMNHISVNDEEGWFDSGMFITGPGFQMVQLFLERVFERHVDRVKLITENNNYKRILQEKIQQLFKVTPVYVMESQPVRGVGVGVGIGGGGGMGDSSGNGVVGAVEGVYQMGVYLCLGQASFGLGRSESVPIWNLEGGIEEGVPRYLEEHGGRGFFFMGEGENRVKKEAEQAACKAALDSWRKCSGEV
jgi:dsRNA-specific ribonuclease